MHCTAAYHKTQDTYAYYLYLVHLLSGVTGFHLFQKVKRCGLPLVRTTASSKSLHKLHVTNLHCTITGTSIMCCNSAGWEFLIVFAQFIALLHWKD